jgi:putative hemolysin
VTSLLVVIAVSLAVSFLCSILEAVLLSTTHAYVAVLEQQKSPAGRVLAGIRRDLDEPIAAILTLNTIAHTVGAALGGALALEVFGSKWIALFSAVLTLAILVLSEILPKTLGAAHWQRLAVPTAYVLRALTLVMRPILIPLALFNRLVSPRGTSVPTVSRAELLVLSEIGRREGTLEEEEWRVVTNVMNLDRVAVREVMTPRTRIIGVPADAGVKQAKAVMLSGGHLRLPVYDGTLDRVVGVLLGRDLFRAEEEGVTDITEVYRPPKFVPESKPVEDLIREMRRERIKMAIVLDEYGGTAGLVTLEDLIEEIVGEIQDEHEREVPPFEEVEGEVRVSGAVAVWAVNERFGLELPDEDYDTMGGLVFGLLGRVPKVGDEVRYGHAALRVLDMQGRRVERLALDRATEGIDG